MENGINVLSLFDGMSCGQLALKRAEIKVNQYYASEIDKHAIKVTQHNFPNTIQLGSVLGVSDLVLPRIDLLIGGSPCQGFSFAGKQLNFEDHRSKLFFEFVRILKELRAENPDVRFLLENVKMKKEYQDVITEYLEVEPIAINSSLVCAQNRRRIYWTNIPNVKEPADKGIMLKDIIHESNGETFDKKYIVPFDKTLKIINKEIDRNKIGYFRQDSQANRVYNIHGKAVTLCGDAGGGAAKMGQYLFGCITPDRIDKRQNGQRFSEGEKFYTLTAQDQHGILIEGYIRKLTPLECERLQTVPEEYTNIVTDAQRYRMLGNGWTVDVIAEILKN